MRAYQPAVPSTGGLDDAQVRAIVDEVLGAHTDVETAHHVPPTRAQDSVEDTANRLINAAGHARNTRTLSAADQAIQRNANALTTHEATPHDGGNGGTPATSTPTVVLVDGALYSAYGDITIPGWRGYDFFQLLFTNGADTYQSEPINSVQLIAHSPVVVSMSRNVGWRLTIDASDDDVITIASTGGNAIAAPTAASAMTVIGWFAGTVVDGWRRGLTGATIRPVTQRPKTLRLLRRTLRRRTLTPWHLRAVRAAVTTLTHGPLRATTNYLSRPIRSTSLSRSRIQIDADR